MYETGKVVMKNGVPLDLSTLKMHQHERDAGLVEGEKLRIREDRWREIRFAVVQRAVDLILAGQMQPRMTVWMVVEIAAHQVLDNPTIFTQMNWDARNRIEHSIKLLVRRGLDEMARRKAEIAVQTMDGQLLGVPAPGMDEINMMDEQSTAILDDEQTAADDEMGHSAFEANSLEAQAARAGVPIVKNAAAGRTRKEKPTGSALPDCECGCGDKTLGGRFIPGHDAKLKSRLVNKWRDAEEGSPERDAAYGELIRLGWEKFAVEKPRSKKPGKGDGLGVGTYSIKDEKGELLQRVADDGVALDWIEENGYELRLSFPEGIIVAKADPEDEDEEDEEDDSDEDDAE